MKARKGFTLIELMVVVLIVAILAAVAIPIMRGRIDAAKWSEGRAMAGTLATGIRAYYAEKGDLGSEGANQPTFMEMGFETDDFDGTYFSSSNYNWITNFDSTATPPLTFTITVAPPAEIRSPDRIHLDQDGIWTESP